MQNEGPNSVRLYQDLLAINEAGPSIVPGIHYVRSFGYGTTEPESCSTNSIERPYKPWIAAGTVDSALKFVVDSVGPNSVGQWLGTQIAGQASLINYSGHLVDVARGRACLALGPILRLYRVNPPGTLNGFAHAFASSSRPSSNPFSAFDGEPTYWVPDARDAAPMIGFDFGSGAHKIFTHVRVDWPTAALAAARIEVQYSDNSKDWAVAAAFDGIVSFQNVGFATSEHELPPNIGAHRYWRVLLHRRADTIPIAVRELRFIGDNR
jgi:hypothetical protein